MKNNGIAFGNGFGKILYKKQAYAIARAYTFSL